MKKCWIKEINLRPSFSEISTELKEIQKETILINVY
jgi:hypothetical protein